VSRMLVLSGLVMRSARIKTSPEAGSFGDGVRAKTTSSGRAPLISEYKIKFHGKLDTENHDVVVSGGVE